jgi:hypothetical protein
MLDICHGGLPHEEYRCDQPICDTLQGKQRRPFVTGRLQRLTVATWMGVVAVLRSMQYSARTARSTGEHIVDESPAAVAIYRVP